MRLLAALSLASALAAADGLVVKTIDRFAAADWTVSEYGPAGGATARDGDALALTATFAAGTFQWSGLHPVRPLAAPGATRQVVLECRADPAFQVQVTFVDGWGRGKVDGKDLKVAWDPSGAWEAHRIDVPVAWLQPVQVSGITLHNSAKRKAGGTTALRLRSLVVGVDTAGADPATGLPPGWKPAPDKPGQAPPRAPLCGLAIAGTMPAIVFAGTPPAFRLELVSWLPGRLAGELTWRVIGEGGAELAAGRLPGAVEDRSLLELAPAVARFGVHRLEVRAELAGAPALAASARFAVLPEPVVLTPEEQAASPYGLCVHGGRQRMPAVFARAGIRWFRDYCFDWEWTVHSQGADNAFRGWPDHQRIAQEYAAAGVGLLPVLRNAIPRPAKDAAPGSAAMPGPELASHLAALVRAFPGLRHWELDNEYDLGCAGYEKQMGWAHYRAWHRAFAAALHGLGPGLIAVENGRAGIYPALLREAVLGGDFAGIDVANVHHYCGADPPERNVANCNTAVEGADYVPALFADRLRDTVAAAAADGRRRQVWLSEFGWDDLAGPRVPTALKTAWLPRGFIAALSAGVARAFWFYDLSHTPEDAKRFFDGCGLIGGDGGPEPALAAYAGLARILPAPRWVGPLAGEGWTGGVLESRGRLVAALWSADGAPHRLAVAAAELRDVYANLLPAGEVELGEAPVYAVGIPADGPLARQAGYEVTSHRWVQVCAGDAATVALRGPGRGADYLAEVPAGWSCTPAAERDGGAELRLAVPATAAGEQVVRIACREGGATVAVRSVTVQVVPALMVEAPRLAGAPGQAQALLRLRNRSLAPHPVALALHLPTGWTAPDPPALADLAPGEVREVALPLAWRAPLPGEAATVEVRVPGAAAQRATIVVPELRLPRAAAIRIDGELDDWPAGALRGEGIFAGDAPPGTRIGAAWHPDGLYLAIDAPLGGRQTTSPRTFWMQDALEVFLAADGDPAKRAWRAEDLHLWLVPQPEQGRAYLGRWQHGKTNPATAYDLPGMTSAVRRAGAGYRLECLIPRALVPGWDPRPGARIAAAVTLGIAGGPARREAWWPLAKGDGLPWQPGLWGAWILDP